MDEVGEAVLEFNKKCGKAEKALNDFEGRLQKRWSVAREMIEAEYSRIAPEIYSTSVIGADKLKRLGGNMADVIETVLKAMENILKIEYKLSQVFSDMCKTARNTKKTAFKCYKDLTVFFKEEMFVIQKQAISELVAEVDMIATPWKTRTEETEDLLEEMKRCRFNESDDFASKIEKFETEIGLFRSYKPLKIVRNKGKVISMKGPQSK